MTVFRSFLRIGQVGSVQTTGGFGSMTIVFRSGKAIMTDQIGDNNVELECWMSADRVYLHKPGESASQDMRWTSTTTAR